MNRIFILFERRFRNRRAAASRQREQAAAAAAAAAAGQSGQAQTNQAPGQATFAASTTGINSTSAGNPTNQALTGTGGYQSSTIKMPQQQQPPQLMKMQNMRSQQQSAMGGNPMMQRQQTITGLGAGPNIDGSEQQQEQSALDFAQSAAARVTATGSAAAAMAAAKFKMLRSNTLAVAFGKNVNETCSGDQSSNLGGGALIGGVSGLDNRAGQQQSMSSGANLVAVRTKNERVSTLSSPSSRLNRFDFNS